MPTNNRTEVKTAASDIEKGFFHIHYSIDDMFYNHASIDIGSLICTNQWTNILFYVPFSRTDLFYVHFLINYGCLTRSIQ